MAPEPRGEPLPPRDFGPDGPVQQGRKHGIERDCQRKREARKGVIPGVICRFKCRILRVAVSGWANRGEVRQASASEEVTESCLHSLAEAGRLAAGVMP